MLESQREGQMGRGMLHHHGVGQATCPQEKAPFVRVLAEFKNGLGDQRPKSRSEQNLEEGWKAPRRDVGPREAHRALPLPVTLDCFL